MSLANLICFTLPHFRLFRTQRYSIVYDGALERAVDEGSL